MNDRPAGSLRPGPWTKVTDSFCIRDNKGQALAFVYYENERAARNTFKATCPSSATTDHHLLAIPWRLCGGREGGPTQRDIDAPRRGLDDDEAGGFSNLLSPFPRAVSVRSQVAQRPRPVGLRLGEPKRHAASAPVIGRPVQCRFVQLIRSSWVRFARLLALRVIYRMHQFKRVLLQ